MVSLLPILKCEWKANRLCSDRSRNLLLIVDFIHQFERSVALFKGGSNVFASDLHLAK